MIPVEIQRLWRWASTHDRAPVLVPLFFLAAAATAADVILVADFLYDYARGLEGIGTSPTEAITEAFPVITPLVLLFLMLGTPGIAYLAVLLIGPPLIAVCRRINR